MKSRFRNPHFFLFSVVLSVVFIYATVLPLFAGSISLFWEAPSTNEDGTPLDDLAGYKIYYGTVSGTYTQSIDIGKTTSYTISGLDDGRTYYFVVTAYNAAQIESGYSNEVRKTSISSDPGSSQQNSLNVTKAGEGSGTVTSSPAGISCGGDCSEVYPEGTVVTLTAIPDSNSSFAGWSGACAGSGTCTVTMDAARNVSPLFVAQGYTVTATAGSGGSISPSGAISVNYGGSQSFTITPDANYTISSVIVDGENAGAVTSYSFTNVTGNHSINVTFSQDGNELEDAATNLPKTGQTMVYASGDDGTIQAGVEWPSERFTDNGDGTITDTLTGLMWLQDGGCLRTSWRSAQATLAELNSNEGQNTCAGYAGQYTDWRMPTVNELKSLINYGYADSAQWLDTEGFVNVKSTYYWTSTTYPGNPSYAWILRILNGLDSRTGKSERYPLLPVREIDSQGYVAEVPKTGQIMPYSSWDDGSVQAGVEWPSERFADNRDGTITDNLTGLMWLKDGACLKRSKWEKVLDALAGLNRHREQNPCDGYAGDYTDWRLPNIKELESLINYGYADSAQWLDTQGFVRMRASSYWSSTTYLRDERKAWTVNLKKAKRANMRKNAQGSALAVRGGHLSAH